MKKIVFSPTYTSLKVANALTSGEVIDLTDPFLEEVFVNEDSLFIMPCYAGRIPSLASKRLSLIKGNARAIVMVTFGNRAYDDSLLELARIVKANGFKVVAAMAVPTEHNCFRSVASKRPDEDDMRLAKEFFEKAKLKDEELILDTRELIPYKKVYFKLDFAEEKCQNCYTCINLCPSLALDTNFKRDLDKCISCLRCVRVCENKAITLNEEVLSKEKAFYEKNKDRKEGVMFL